MRLLQNMTVKSRLILAGILIIVLFIVFGLVSIAQMQTLGRLTATLYDHPLQVSNAALKAKAGVIRMHLHMKDIYAAQTTPAIALAIQGIQTEERAVYKALDLISRRILGEEGKHLIAQTIELFAAWKPVRVEVEELVLKEGRASADPVLRERAADQAAHLERKMEELAAYALKKADGFMADAERAKNRIVNSIIFFVMGLIFSSMVLGLLISSNIMSSLTALKDTMARITETGELLTVTLPGRNEVTEMARHFNGVIDRLKDVFWIGEGESLLNRALFQDLSEEQLLETGLFETARYVDACAGALYRYDEEEKALLLSASYALVERKHLASRFTLGEGIVGQVAKEKKAIMLHHIHRDEAVGQSATLSEPPAVIYAVPLIFEQKRLYGVMEVASFKRFSKSAQQYIQVACDTIAILMHTSAQSTRIRALLTATEESNATLQSQAQTLQAQARELTAMNEEAEQQSRELQEQNLALEAQRREVEEANRLKSEFLSNMSHELRTPLNSVNALSRVLIHQAGGRLSDEELNYLSIIERNGKHLLNLINDILDLSKIESGQFEVSVSRFSLSALIETILESLLPLAQEKGLTLENLSAGDLPDIESDEPRVFQILQNIVANAVKFTDKGHIRIHALLEKDMFVIRVEDTGIGIPVKDLESIFKEFRQADGASTRRFEGTGLGLSIAYKAARLLGGDIQVESLLGQGSVFTVRLPQHHAFAGEVLDQGRAVSADTAVPVTHVQHRDTVLIVDDDPKTLSLLSQLFSEEGYDTLLASSGREALALAETYQPFAVTLDVIMPDMDGWEVLTRMKQNPATAHIPVIIVTVSEDMDTGLALGALGYVCKPVSRESLIREMTRSKGHLPDSVMIVDDNPLDRESCAKILRSEGVDVIEASSGKACLSLLAAKRPDIVVLDLVMPEMDGFELLTRLRAVPEFSQLPVIVVTAKDVSPAEKEALEGRASSILQKSPLSTKQLLEKIRQVLTNLKGTPFRKGTRQEDRILLVEDNTATVIQVTKALAERSFRVDVARDGRTALEYLSENLPAGIVLDLMMPDVDGFKILEKLRADPRTWKIPVLVLTARDITAEERQRLRTNHIWQLIQKGDVDRAELVRAVSRMLSAEEEAAGPNAPEGLPAKARTPSDDTGRRGKSLLVIEDNQDNLTTLKAVLGTDYDILAAADGLEGLRAAGEEEPDLILLDMALPGLSGMEVMERLRSDPKTSGIPVIALTAQAMKGDRERILAAGCSDYLSKPIDPETVRSTVSKWVEAP